jgi:hypothetical protein
MLHQSSELLLALRSIATNETLPKSGYGGFILK